MRTTFKIQVIKIAVVFISNNFYVPQTSAVDKIFFTHLFLLYFTNLLLLLVVNEKNFWVSMSIIYFPVLWHNLKSYKVLRFIQISLVTMFIWCDDVWMYFITKEMLWKIQTISVGNIFYLVVLFLNITTQINSIFLLECIELVLLPSWI